MRQQLAVSLGCLALALASASPAAQQNYGTGGSGAWAMGAGTRALALGSTAGLLAQDATVLSHNPGALIAVGGEMGFHHGVWDAGLAWDQLAAVLPIGPSDALGISGALASYGSFERTDDLGQETGSYQAGEALSAIGYAHRFGPLSIGAAGFVTRQTIDRDVLFGEAWSLGAHWKPLSYMTAGASLRSASEAFAPGSLEGGLGLALVSQPDPGRAWSMALDSHYAAESSAVLQLGVGRGFRAGRAMLGQLLGGYRLSFGDQADRDSRTSWTLGATIGWNAWAIDYAFVPLGDLEVSQHIGVRYRFPSAGPGQAFVADPGPPPPMSPEPIPAELAPPLPEPVATATLVAASPTASTVVLVLSDGVVLGQNLEAAGQPRQALEAYAEAVKADPKDLMAWKSMAKLYDRLQRPDLGLRCWTAVAHLDPLDPAAAAALKAQEIPAPILP